jgi:hypothetical protein
MADRSTAAPHAAGMCVCVYVCVCVCVRERERERGSLWKMRRASLMAAGWSRCEYVRACVCAPQHTNTEFSVSQAPVGTRRRGNCLVTQAVGSSTLSRETQVSGGCMGEVSGGPA